MRVVTFNMHAGVDGWGNPTPVVGALAQLMPDIAVVPEVFRADDGYSMDADLRERLGAQGTFVPLGHVRRITSGHRHPTWQPVLAHFTGDRGLFYESHRELTPWQERALTHATTVERGEWGLALYSRLPIISTTVHDLGQLARERVRRCLIVSKVRDGERDFYVVALHGSHLSHGSFHYYHRVAAILDDVAAKGSVVLAGDFNCWRPLLRVLLPRWRTLARHRTWPATLPHSQIDHILGRGPWVSERSGAVAAGSDHRALWADIRLR